MLEGIVREGWDWGVGRGVGGVGRGRRRVLVRGGGKRGGVRGAQYNTHEGVQ